ncbi:MAG: hypothetical protein J0H49_22685 [Acidobacteria bacterium]|nr:hypothetical protein [Acidobacteriota bacterium]
MVTVFHGIAGDDAGIVQIELFVEGKPALGVRFWLGRIAWFWGRLGSRTGIPGADDAGAAAT